MMPNRSETSKLIGQRLKAARKACGLTQPDAANKAGVKLGTLNRWECGGCCNNPNNLFAMCRVYGVTPKDILPEGETTERLQEIFMRDPKAKFLSAQEATEVLYINQHSLCEWCRNGEIPSVRISRKHYILKDDVPAIKKRRG